MMVKHHKILIFSSGSGTNAEQIIRYFSPKPSVEVLGVYSNNPSAFVLERAKQLGVSTHVFNREEFNNTECLLKNLQAQSPDLIVLAGFLWKVPSHIIDAFPNKIINIHPALLPKFGGKGMYGHHVHQAGPGLPLAAPSVYRLTCLPPGKSSFSISFEKCLCSNL